MIAVTECPKCGNGTVEADLIENDRREVVAVVYTCHVCETVFM